MRYDHGHHIEFQLIRTSDPACQNATWTVFCQASTLQTCVEMLLCDSGAYDASFSVRDMRQLRTYGSPSRADRRYVICSASSQSFARTRFMHHPLGRTQSKLSSGIHQEALFAFSAL